MRESKTNLNISKPSIAAICIGIDTKEIERTICSLAEISYYLQEIVVVDSTNQFQEEIPKLVTCKMKHIRQYPPKGISNAFNRGLQEATAEYIVFYNGGDACEKEGFIRHFEIIREYPKTSIVAGNVILECEGENILWKPRIENGKIFQIHHIGTIYRKNLHNVCGLYDPMMKCAMDYSFLRRAIISLKDDEVILSNTVCGRFKMGGVSSLMSKRKNKEVLATDLLTGRSYLKASMAYFKSIVGSKLRECARSLWGEPKAKASLKYNIKRSMR